MEKVVFVLKEYDLIITNVDHLANFSNHKVLLPEIFEKHFTSFRVNPHSIVA